MFVSLDDIAFIKIESTVKVKNLLLDEQIYSFNSPFQLKSQI